MSENFVNQVTLQYFMNKDQFENMLKKKNALESNKKDKEFYYQRIMQMTEELFQEDTSAISNFYPDVKYAFDNYIKTCIHYFKTVDQFDIIQEEYKDMEEDMEEIKDIKEIKEIDDEEELKDLDKILGINANEESKADTDRLMMRSIKLINPTLDQFVTRTQFKPIATPVYPSQKNINLSDPQLQLKGLNQKKNITSIYDNNNKYENENKYKDKCEDEDEDEDPYEVAEIVEDDEYPDEY